MKSQLLLLFILLTVSDVAFAQPAERSLPFDKSLELRSGDASDEIRASAPSAIQSNEKLIRELESSSSDDSKYEFDQLLSLSEFEHSHLIFAQNILLSAIENEPNASVKRSEALFISSLELLSSPSLSIEDVAEAEKKLKEIPPNAFIEESAIDAEYHFWLGEVLRSEHNFSGAIEAYTSSLEKNLDGSLSELVRFRRAELYEHELRYIAASEDFDTLASHPSHALRLYASLRRASLLRTMRKYQDGIAECSRASILASDTSHLKVSQDARDMRYRPFLSALHKDQGSLRDTFMLASPYTRAEILLLRGSEFSGLQQYDSAEYFFERGESALSDIKDSFYFDREKSYLAHALEFERAWVKLSVGENDEAARIFSSLAKGDTAQQKNPLFFGGTSDNSGAFYHDEKISPININAARSIQLDTSRFIYDDYPARARFYVGIALSRAGKVTEAREILTNLSQDPTAIYADKARYHLALVEFKSGRTLQAEGLLAPIALHRTQSGIFASIILGDIHYRRSSFAKASGYFEFALANLPDNDTALRSVASLERGLSLLPLGSWNESAQDLKLYISLASQQTPGLDEALFWLGRAYFRSDSIQQSRNCFKRVLDEFSNSTRIIDAQYGYAWTLFRNGEYKLADKEFAKVIEMDSITRYAYDALSRQGDALYAGGNLKKALAIYNLAVDRPTFNEYRTTRSLYQLGVIRMRADSARSAMNAFHMIINKFPKSDILDRAYYDYAVAAYAIKKDDKANEAVGTLVNKFKDSPYATKGLYLVASEEERNGNYKEAYTSYKKIISDHPSSEEFQPSLSGAINTLSQLKKYDEAIALADTFLVRVQNASYAPALLYHKGEIQLLASNPKQAEQTFQEFSERFPKDTLLPMSKYMLGKATSFSDKDKAFDLYSVVAEKYPHSNAATFAYFAMARLERNERKEKNKAAEYYTKAFDMEFYSSEAAPQAMFEYAGFIRNDLGKPDSAIRIYDDLTNRYFIETTIGGKSQLETAEILLSSGKRNDAVLRLQKLADAQEGYELAAEARLRLAALYTRDGATRKALAEFDRAREDNITTKEQLGKSYIGSAECNIAIGDKKTARQVLAELLVTRGISQSRRETAKQLLESITPKKKKKRK